MDDPLAVFVLSGTSMATPITAGTALLVREYYKKGYYPTGSPLPENGFNPTAALLKATIINSGQAITGYYVPPGTANSFFLCLVFRSLVSSSFVFLPLSTSQVYLLVSSLHLFRFLHHKLANFLG